MHNTRKLFVTLTCAAAFAAIGCGASVLGAMSDSIDAGRQALRTSCSVETPACETKRVLLNDVIAAYDLALAGKDGANAGALEQAAVDAFNAFIVTMQKLDAPPPAPPTPPNPVIESPARPPADAGAPPVPASTSGVTS